MPGYACEWPDCHKTYKKAADLERHERLREHDDNNPRQAPQSNGALPFLHLGSD
jgi:hypothetical protein